MNKVTKHLTRRLYRQITVYLFVIFGSLFVSGLLFTSCSSDVGMDSRSDSENNDDDEELGDCTDYESCEYICKRIYGESSRACSREDAETVSNLQKIYNRLKQTRVEKTTLNEISEEQHEIELDYFRRYLEIGLDGWLRHIEGYTDRNGTKTAYKPDQARETIEWLVDNERVAEILLDVDGGRNILKVLLETARDGNDCFWKGSISAKVEGEVSFEREELRYIKISIIGGKAIFKIRIRDSKCFDLYDLLSCTNVDGSGDAESDIFSLAADEENEYLFNLAFELLDDVCRDSLLISNYEQEEEICRRAMMCALAVQYEVGKDSLGTAANGIHTWNGWDYAEERFTGSYFDRNQACDINDTKFGGNINRDGSR